MSTIVDADITHMKQSGSKVFQRRDHYIKVFSRDSTDPKIGRRNVKIIISTKDYNLLEEARNRELDEPIITDDYIETQYAPISRRSYKGRVQEVVDNGCTIAPISYTSSGIYADPKDTFKNIRHSYGLSNVDYAIINGALYNKKTSDNIPFLYVKSVYRDYNQTHEEIIQDGYNGPLEVSEHSIELTKEDAMDLLNQLDDTKPC